MNSQGFLGTNALLLADISLLLGFFVALTLTFGMYLARQRRYEAHRWVQTTAVLINWAQVLTVMVASFLRSAAPGLPSRIDEPFYYAAVIHAVLGLWTLLFGTFVMLRGNGLVPRVLAFKRYKPFMRLAYGSYIAVTLLGIWVYVVWYTGDVRPEDARRAIENLSADPQSLVVPIANFDYAPNDVVVPVGTTVTWLNQDRAPHTITADDDTLFRSDFLSSGGTFEQRFDQIGTFPYYCELHGSAGGIGMSGTMRVVAAAEAPPLVAVVPELATPTPQPTSHPLPAEPFGQPAGTAAFRDALAPSDQIVVDIAAAAVPAGATLEVMLVSTDNASSLSLGSVERDGGERLQLAYTSPDGENLAARFSRIVVVPAGGSDAAPLLEGRLPPQAFRYLAQLLADGPLAPRPLLDGQPEPRGYLVGLRAETDELVRHARFVAASQAAGDEAGVARHAEHVFNLIVGSRDDRFGDLNGDGRSQNAGDGFGLLSNGDQLGYLPATLESAQAAASATDATRSIKIHAEHVEICVNNMLAWATEARELALDLAEGTRSAADSDAVERLVALAQMINRGQDANGDGEIAPVPDEGGALVAYEHAQFMAGFGLFPAE